MTAGGHIDIRNLVAQHPRRFRRRTQRAKGVPPSRANELWYKSQLLLLVKLLRSAVAESLNPALRAISAPSGTGDALTPDLEAVFNQIAGKFGGIQTTALRLSRLAAERNRRYVDSALAANLKKSVGVDISGLFTSPSGASRIAVAMNAAVTANVELITSIQDDYLANVAQIVSDNLTKGLRWEELVSLISHEGEVTESRAKLIARDQTNKMNGAFIQERQTEVGISQYVWRTAGDERVRETHADNEGQVFSWDDPPDTGHPGEDIQCRCIAEPYFNLDDDTSTDTDEELPQEPEDDVV